VLRPVMMDERCRALTRESMQRHRVRSRINLGVMCEVRRMSLIGGAEMLLFAERTDEMSNERSFRR
jgi:hypothetical protein